MARKRNPSEPTPQPTTDNQSEGNGKAVANPLSERATKFAHLISAGLPGTAAYIAAGFKPGSMKTAGSEASTLARDPRVKAIVEAERSSAMQTVELTPAWWVNQQILEASGQVEGVKSTPASRSAAYERLGRYLGLYQAERASDYSTLSNDELLKLLPQALLVLKQSGRPEWQQDGNRQSRLGKNPSETRGLLPSRQGLNTPDPEPEEA